MIRTTGLFIISTLFLAPISWARIQEHEMEQERLSGYKDHIVENQVYDRERLRSYRAYLESVEKEIFEKNKALRDFKKKQKKDKAENEEIAEYKEYLDDKKKEDREYEAAKTEYKKNQKKGKAVASRRNFTEEEELEIFAERPRYDYKRRALYGAKPKYKIAIQKGGSSGGGSGSYTPPGGDFVNDSGYIPPPPPPPPPMELPNEPFYDEIPPPPPPPPMPGDFGSDPGMGGDGYIPPPPPPPPMFDGEF